MLSNTGQSAKQRRSEEILWIWGFQKRPLVAVTVKIARTHGHRTDSACCRRTPCLHHLRTASVRLLTISVRIGTASTMVFPLVKWSKIRTETVFLLSKWSQYGLKRYFRCRSGPKYGLKQYANGLKWYANGASMASIYSRLSPSYARAYVPFSLCVEGVQSELRARECIAMNGTELPPGYSQPLHKELMLSTMG